MRWGPGLLVRRSEADDGRGIYRNVPSLETRSTFWLTSPFYVKVILRPFQTASNCVKVSHFSPDWWQVLWPSRGPSTASMLKGSPQWRHMITRRSGAPECEDSGGPMLRWPEALCLMLSTRARRLSSITAPSLISSQSSSRKGHCRLSARFCPSSLRRRLSFSDNLVSGWKRITSGRPWKQKHDVINCVGVVSLAWLGLSRSNNKDI